MDFPAPLCRTRRRVRFLPGEPRFFLMISLEDPIMTTNFSKVTIIASFALLMSISLLRDANAASSDDLISLCKAAGGTVFDEGEPTAYLESGTSQNSESRLYFSNGYYFFRLDNSLGGGSGQSNRVKDAARLAFTYGYPVSICASNNGSPRTIWILEVHMSDASKTGKRAAVGATHNQR